MAEYLNGPEDTMQEHLLGNGPTAALERRLRDYFGVRYALALANATSALFAVQLAFGLQGTEIVTGPFAYGASFAGALHLRNRLRFADVDAGLNIEAEAVRATVTPRTRAILSLDFNGTPANTTALRKVADDCNLLLLVDAAQSAGAMIGNAPATKGADATVISFTFGKTIAAGEGGAILTDNRELYERLIALTQHPLRQKRDLSLKGFDEFNFNFRLHPLAAIWADAVFNQSIESLRQWQQEWRQVTNHLASCGLIVSSEHFFNSLPSRFRPTIISADGTNIYDLNEALHSIAPQLCLQPLALIPVYANRFQQRKAGGLIQKSHCPVAEKYSRSAFTFRLILDKQPWTAFKDLR
ncbi:MAG: DegT/DnrJ/EryC1/StrS family aminotransferase [Terracidiphilus sp.]|jgi:dTDP-4-amino-4,6-dideoxygalactose transaminase